MAKPICMLQKVRIGDISSFVPSDYRRKHWHEFTGTKWDLLDAAESMTSQMVECPRCNVMNTVRKSEETPPYF